MIDEEAYLKMAEKSQTYSQWQFSVMRKMDAEICILRQDYI